VEHIYLSFDGYFECAGCDGLVVQVQTLAVSAQTVLSVQRGLRVGPPAYLVPDHLAVRVGQQGPECAGRQLGAQHPLGDLPAQLDQSRHEHRGRTHQLCKHSDWTLFGQGHTVSNADRGR